MIVKPSNIRYDTIQFNGNNYNDIFKLLKDIHDIEIVIKLTDNNLKIIKDKHVHIVQIGDYILKSNGEIIIGDSTFFQKLFTPV